jgi:hypothetical protein
MALYLTVAHIFWYIPLQSYIPRYTLGLPLLRYRACRLRSSATARPYVHVVSASSVCLARHAHTYSINTLRL